VEWGGEYPVSLVFTRAEPGELKSFGGGFGVVDSLYCVKVSLLVSSLRARAAAVSKWKSSEADLVAWEELEELVLCVELEEKNEFAPEL